MNKNDGGPAFPIGIDVMSDQDGMALLDWFAGQALPAVGMMVTHPDASARDGGPITPSHMADLAYEIARAMLAERSKP